MLTYIIVAALAVLAFRALFPAAFTKDPYNGKGRPAIRSDKPDQYDGKWMG